MVRGRLQEMVEQRIVESYHRGSGFSELIPKLMGLVVSCYLGTMLRKGESYSLAYIRISMAVLSSLLCKVNGG